MGRFGSHLAAGALSVIVLACSSSGGTPAQQNLTVYAAASLTAAFKDLAAAYQAGHPGVTITLSFDSSSALRAQIEQGAPADVFASADTANPQRLVDDGLGLGPLTNFAGNRLTVIVPASGSGPVATPVDLAKVGVRVIAAGAAVPITRYANLLLANLGRQPGYPPDFAARVAANIASKEDNVKAVVSKVELGEGDAAIVYVTDAAASANVRAIDVPAAANVPAVYAGVVVKASKHPATAAAFLGWVASPDGRAILARYGFLPPA
jgi:molybdate transport system substrate-binding protein